MPPQACVNAPQRYELRAGEAFAVVGTRSGYIHSDRSRDAETGKCVRDPNATPVEVGRIPLDAAGRAIRPRIRSPAAVPTARSSRTRARPPSTETEFQPNYAERAVCTSSTPAIVTATRQAPAVRFRNRGMT